MAPAAIYHSAFHGWIQHQNDEAFLKNFEIFRFTRYIIQLDVLLVVLGDIPCDKNVQSLCLLGITICFDSFSFPDCKGCILLCILALEKKCNHCIVGMESLQTCSPNPLHVAVFLIEYLFDM